MGSYVKDTLVFFFIILIGLPILFLVLTPFFIWRIFVKLMAICFNQKLLSMLGGVEHLGAVDMYGVKTPAINILLTLDGVLDINTLKHNLTKDILYYRDENSNELKYGRYLKYPTTWLGYVFWVWDKKFDINNHIKLCSVSIDETNQDKVIGELMNNGFEKNRPLWEIYVIPGHLETLLFFRVHHTICDGYSLVKLLGARAMGLKTIKTSFPTPSHKSWNQNGNSPNRNPQKNCCDKIFQNTIGAPNSYFDECKVLTEPNCFRRPLNGKSFISSTKLIPLSKFKNAKLRLKAPLTAIVNSAIAGALHTFVSNHYGDDQVPVKISGQFSCPKLNHPDDKLVNCYGIGMTTIPILAPDYQSRLRSASFEWSKTIHSKYSLFISWTINLMSLFPLNILERMLGGDVKSMNFLISNMPGPVEIVSLWGNTILDMMFWLPVVVHSIQISILSYNGNIKIGFNVDKEVVETQGTLNIITKNVEDELNKIFEVGSNNAGNSSSNG